ncbi:MAG: beta-hydroxyacyl-ACP dehydratase [Planctomycetota bacterium]|nr:beta-hydroxyacyl-ACP dehydratase [Planctomycetota bacterium]
MPTAPLIDFEAIDLEQVVATKSEVQELLRQRGSFALLDGILHIDDDRRLAIGYKDVSGDDWWVPDHIPGRPLFPGALMIEAAAQLCSYDFIRRNPDWITDDRFVGFAGVDRVRFRGAVEPSCRFTIVALVQRIRSNIFTYQTQGFVDRRLVFEAVIMGMLV